MYIKMKCNSSLRGKLFTGLNKEEIIKEFFTEPSQVTFDIQRGELVKYNKFTYNSNTLMKEAEGTGIYIGDFVYHTPNSKNKYGIIYSEILSRFEENK